MVRALTPRKSDQPNRKHFPKNNSFCFRWRVVDNFNKTIERDLFEQHLSGGQYHQSLQNERILALYKMTYRRCKNDFISQLTRDAMNFLDTRRAALSNAVRQESAYTRSMANVVDTLFNILLSCSIELNTVLGFSELFVAANEPEIETYVLNGQSKVRSLHCRFSSSLFSLVVHGEKNRIEFHVVPVEVLYGNKHPGSDHEPVALCTAELLAGERVKWSVHMPIQNHPDPYAKNDLVAQDLTEESLENVCHYVLRQLIEQTQQVLSQTNPI